MDLELLAEENLTVNAIVLGLVASALPDTWLIEQCPPEHITPVGLVTEAFDDSMNEEIVDGKLTRKTG